MIAFKPDDVIGAVTDDLFHHMFLAAHGVGGDDLAFL
jgi:hypothetical protein